MDKKLRLKTVGLLLLTILAICVLLPTFVGDSLPSGFTNVFSKKISKGIDIDGGSYLVYDINLDKAVDDKAIEIKRDLKYRMEKSAKDPKNVGVVTAPSNPLGAVVATVTDASTLSGLKAGFMDDYGDQVTTYSCPSTVDASKSLCVKVSSDYAQDIRVKAIKQAVITVGDRINKGGIGGATVVEKGDQIIVELPGADEELTNRTKKQIEQTAKLEFKLVDQPLAGQPQNTMGRLVGLVALAKQMNDGTTPADDTKVKASVRDFVRDYELTSVTTQRPHQKTGKVFQENYITARTRTEAIKKEDVSKWNCDGLTLAQERKLKLEGGDCKIIGRDIIERFLGLVATEHGIKIDDDHQMAYGTWDEDEAQGDKLWRTWYLFREAAVDGAQLIDASQGFDQDNSAVVNITMNRVASEAWADITTKQTGARFAIMFNGKVNSAPHINEPIRGGSSQISMGAAGQKGVDEAKAMETSLKSGSLPAPLQLQSESLRGPSLGNDAVDKAKVSFLIGSLLVLLIMMYYYRNSGAISLLSLSLNILLMLAVLVQFEAALTLPGIAALVLTVGMAVDANIIVYERIREELRLGKSVRGSVDAGFKHGFSAILDGQLTTAVAAWVLLQYTSEDAIRGFAIMLLIGIACTLFSSYWCTKLFFEHYVGRKKDIVIGI